MPATLPLHRRTGLRGMVGLVAAPPIVRVAALMPVKAWRPEPFVVGIDWSQSSPDHVVIAVVRTGWQMDYYGFTAAELAAPRSEIARAAAHYWRQSQELGVSRF